jgi:type IV pilus assembly protein PilA
VVAIIGILAAIAIPNYQKYVTRARLTEAMNFLGAARNDLAEYYQTQNKMPQVDGPDGLEALTIEDISSSVVASLDYKKGTDPDHAVLIANIRPSVFHEPLSNPQLGWFAIGTRGTITWTCAAYSDSIPTKYLPADCRNGTPQGF